MSFQFANLIWGVSEKKDGQMILGENNINDQAFLNRQKFFSQLGISTQDIVSAGLAHSNKAALVSKRDKGQIIPGVDGLITKEKNLFLTITVADCLPIYFYDYKKKIVGLAHAGWQGIRQNICQTMVSKMVSEFQTKPEDLIIYIGPHIQKCHFTVRDDVIKQFKAYQEFIIKKDDYTTIDLLGIVKQQLDELGVSTKNISAADNCTYCQKEKYFSYRRDKPEILTAMVAYIGKK
jgi:YfiH family protein